MTKEELKLEAIKYLENFNDCANCKNRWGDCADQLDEYCLENGCCFAIPKEQDIYLASAEPREKRIAELEQKLETERSSRIALVKKIAELEAQIGKMKCCINDLVHLGEFNEHTDEEYFNYQVHEALKNAEQFIKEIKEK